MKTHSNLTDPRLRKILHDEIVVLHSQYWQAKRTQVPMSDDWFSGVLIGFETALRRVQDAGEAVLSPMGLRSPI